VAFFNCRIGKIVPNTGAGYGGKPGFADQREDPSSLETVEELQSTKKRQLSLKTRRWRVSSKETRLQFEGCGGPALAIVKHC